MTGLHGLIHSRWNLHILFCFGVVNRHLYLKGLLDHSWGDGFRYDGHGRRLEQHFWSRCWLNFFPFRIVYALYRRSGPYSFLRRRVPGTSSLPGNVIIVLRGKDLETHNAGGCIEDHELGLLGKSERFYRLALLDLLLIAAV